MNKLFTMAIMSFLAFISISCSISKLEGDINLGGDYYLWTEDGDTRSSCIILSTTKPYKGTGLTVLPPSVIQAKHNKKYIIVNTQNIESNQSEYWIINKDIPINLESCIDKESCDRILRSNVIGPFTFQEFMDYTEKNEVKIKFD